ncbi:MAG: tRNA pseudouridine(13) synthase TruD [DPANN group archaeon]|nr:tRNA pseudouridine(13) synthase TruD [DPANN group archaeon]
MDSLSTILTLRSGVKLHAKLKQIPSDFVVEEISRSGQLMSFDSVSEDNFNFDILKYSKGTQQDRNVGSVGTVRGGDGGVSYVLLHKIDYDPFKAIDVVAKALNVRRNDIAFAGTKDKRAVTTQIISIANTTKEAISNFNVKDISLKYLGCGSKIQLGDLLGNRFTIVLRNIDCVSDKLSTFFDFKETIPYPNYFGPQRFGDKRPITHIIGKHILKGNYKSAVLDYVSKIFPGDNSRSAAIRTLAASNPKQALESNDLKSYERMLVQYLVDYPENYKGAIQKFPLQLRRMFIHAYQSYLFNKVLNILIKGNISDKKIQIPYFGYHMNLPRNRNLVDALRLVFSEEKIDLSDFRVEGMEVLSSKGGNRNAFEFARDFKVIDISEDDLNVGRSKIKIAFTLSKGSYATVFLREFFNL